MNAAGRTFGLLLLLALAGADALAQERPAAAGTGRIAGTVVEAQHLTPIRGAEVVLPDVGLRTLTDDDGAFRFTRLEPGTVRLRVSRLGYADSEGSVVVEEATFVEVEILMDVEPLPIDPITVTATRNDRPLVLPGLQDLEVRRRSGWGQFILEEDIRGRALPRVTDYLHGATGVEVLALGQAITMRRTGCPPTVYLDDVKITHCPVGGGQPRSCNPFQESADAVNLLPPSEIFAIEVYRGPGETPGQYLDSNSRCGVIVIWTKRGGGVERDR